AHAVAVQPDGKIVVAGSATVSGTGGDFALARYNADGSLDTTFSGDGKVTTDFALGLDQVFGVAIQPDGKIVTAGSAYIGTSTDRDFALARYNADGSLDTTFSGDGKMTTDFGQREDEAHGVAIQPDGKIVTAGSAHMDTNTSYDFAFARYDLDGSPDSSF